ncbi:MAG TPA: class II aldolase/adducin family protein [Nitrososphaeraceae archaeon]|nr:class II aldolase/adducin family protein [Nitrososphaeraceae archaeon]
MAYFIGNSFCKLCQNNEENLQNELLFCSNGLKTKGLFPPFKSFHSTRLPHSNKIWITPLIKSALNRDVDNNYNFNYFECNCLDIDDNRSIDIFNSFSFEIKLHSKLYKFRPDVNAICHTKSPFTISSFLNGKLENVHGEAALILGDIPVIKFDRDLYDQDNCSENNIDEILDLIAKSSIGEPLRPIRTIILPKHGVIALGACLHEARAFVEILEEWARFNIYSKIIGISSSDGGRPIHTLSLDQLRSLGSRYARSIKFGGRQSSISDYSTILK